MKITQIRNATLAIEYAGKRILVDPMLSNKGELPPMPMPAKDWNMKKNPLCDLPFSKEEIIKDIDFVFLSHLHPDHWDKDAANILPKDIKIFVQDSADKKKIEKSGFTNVEILTEHTSFDGISLSRTKAQHGRGFILLLAGHVCGLVLKHPEEKALYITADSVWYDGVEDAIKHHQPDVIVANGGDNQFCFGGQLIMGKEDIHSIHKTAPDADIIVSHMEAINHSTLSRKELRDFINEKGIGNKVSVPSDGETIIFENK